MPVTPTLLNQDYPQSLASCNSAWASDPLELPTAASICSHIHTWTWWRHARSTIGTDASVRSMTPTRPALRRKKVTAKRRRKAPPYLRDEKEEKRSAFVAVRRGKSLSLR